MTAMRNSMLPPFTLLDEPLLAFSPTNRSEVDANPLRGLSCYGPYSKSSFGRYTSVLRVATVGPHAAFQARADLMNALKVRHPASDRREYVPDYPGFEALYKVRLTGAHPSAHIRWPDSLADLPGDGDAHARVYAAMESALRRLDGVRNEFDVALVHFPDHWAEATRGENFDAHDVLKGLGAQYNIPTQVLNDRAFTFTHKASLAWRLATALYVKAAGTPWKLAPVSGVPEGTAYIGLAYALRGDQSQAHYVTCCSQVFDMDGGGMQFVAFEARDPVADVEEARRNPFLTREDMRAVLARSLKIYQQRNEGLPRRLVIHKTTSFKEPELAGVFDATAGIDEVECIEVSTTSCWRGVWLVESGRSDRPTMPANYPVPRGTAVVRSPNSAWVWVAGNQPAVSNKNDYYQGKKSIPKPLHLIRHSGKGPLEQSCLEVLALTKMDWNNDALYDPVPVSIRYSQLLARTIANVPNLPGNVYPYRMFM